MNLEDVTLYIVAALDGVLTDPFVATTTPGTNIASGVRQIAGVGNPYYAFTTIPFDFSNGIVVNFTGAPVCSEDVTVNSATIIAMLETPPLDKISAP